MSQQKLALSLLFVAGVVAGTSAEAATFTVNATTDAVDANPGDGVCQTAAAGECTLRAAVMEANKLPGPDNIVLPAGKYQLFLHGTASTNPFGESDDSVGDLDIKESLTITGVPGAPDTVVIDGGYALPAALNDRLFQLSPGQTFGPTGGATGLDVTISGVTLTGGWQPSENLGGGAIAVDFNQFGPPQFGLSRPKLTLRNSIVQTNFAWVTGGGIANYGGEILIEDTVFRDNRTPYTPNIVSPSGQIGGFQGGAFIGGGQGGSIAVWSGSVTMRRCVITSSYAQNGGGVYTQDASNFPSSFVAEDTVIQGNFSFMGGGIFNAARGVWNAGASGLVTHGAILTRVTMEANQAEYAGAGAYNIGTLLVANSTISANQAWDAPGNPSYTNKGGGIYNSGRVLDIRSSTIAGNDAEEIHTSDVTADLSSGGDEIFFDAINASSGASTQPFRFTIQNSIIGDGAPTRIDDPGVGVDDNCSGPIGYQALITSLGNNLDSGTTCFGTGVAVAKALSVAAVGDLTGQTGVLQPLANNGSVATLPGGTPIKTLALVGNSAAVGSGASCPGTDGRGFARVGACDVGAFQVAVNKQQVAANVAPTVKEDHASANVGSTAAITVDVLANDFDPDAVGKLTITNVTSPSSFGTTMIQTDPTTKRSMLMYQPSGTATAGAIDTVTYTVSDGTMTANGQLLVHYYAVASNQAPTVTTVALTATKDMVLNFGLVPSTFVSDPDVGDTVSVVSVTGTTSGGTIALAGASNVITFTPAAGFTGTFGFNFQVKDNRGATANGLGTIVVSAIPPVSVAPGATVAGSIPPVVASGAATVTYSVSASPNSGKASVNSSGQFLYTANADAVAGADAFTVAASVNNAGVVSNVTVAVKIEIPNKPPVVDATKSTPATATIKTTEMVSGKIVAADPEGDLLTYRVTTQGTKGTATVEVGGQFMYMPGTAAGQDSFTITIQDSKGASTPFTVAVTITDSTVTVGTDPLAGGVSKDTSPPIETPSNPVSNPTVASGSGGGASLNLFTILFGALLFGWRRARAVKLYNRVS